MLARRRRRRRRRWWGRLDRILATLLDLLHIFLANLGRLSFSTPLIVGFSGISVIAMSFSACLTCHRKMYSCQPLSIPRGHVQVVS